MHGGLAQDLEHVLGVSNDERLEDQTGRRERLHGTCHSALKRGRRPTRIATAPGSDVANARELSDVGDGSLGRRVPVGHGFSPVGPRSALERGLRYLEHRYSPRSSDSVAG